LHDSSSESQKKCRTRRPFSRQALSRSGIKAGVEFIEHGVRKVPPETALTDVAGLPDERAEKGESTELRERAARPESTDADERVVRLVKPKEKTVSSRRLLPIGTRVVAVRNFGLIEEGAPGIITGAFEASFFWWSRPMYLCTFAGNMKIAAKPREIDDFDHGYQLAELENPDPVKMIFSRPGA